VLPQLEHFLLGLTNKLGLGVRRNQVIGRKRQTAAGTFAEPELVPSTW
jgi:hypothetical protein